MPLPTNAELANLSNALPAWTLDPARNAIRRRLQFSTFGEAFAALIRIGVEADKRDHHPEWSNIYGTIDIMLTSHDLGGVCERDMAWRTSLMPCINREGPVRQLVVKTVCPPHYRGHPERVSDPERRVRAVRASERFVNARGEIFR